MNYSPFDVARTIGNNFSARDREKRDTSAIEKILAEASASGDPDVINDSIGKLLSQVSPERQGMALQFLQNEFQKVQKRKDQDNIRDTYEELGIPGLQNFPPVVQAQMIKDKNKSDRLSTYGLNTIDSRGDLRVKNEEKPLVNEEPKQAQLGSVFTKLNDDQLVVASGSPDREVSEPAKLELKRRVADRELEQKKNTENRKYHSEISQEVIKENEKEAKSIIEAESALNLMENAIAEKDLSFWSLDNLAEISGIEGFRSPEGSLFKTAGKEFFLGSLNRAGARPNQFIEKQIVEMLPRIGRSTAANLSVARAFKNEIDIKKEKVRLTRELADSLESELGYVPRNIGKLRDEKLREYAEGKQKELNNDLRAFKAIEEKSKQPFIKVNPGTPISRVVAKALLDQFDKKDPDRTKKAAKQAEELGYVF